MLDRKEQLQIMAENIRTRRLAKGITQVQMAQATGMSQTRVSEIENACTHPGVLAIARIAFMLDCTVDELMTPATKEVPHGGAADAG